MLHKVMFTQATFKVTVYGSILILFSIPTWCPSIDVIKKI